MAGSSSSYAGVELRKLPPRFRNKLAQLMEDQDDWKKLMCTIPSELNPHATKYRAEDILLIERHSRKSNKLCGEILLDEWSSSGKKRPTVDTLLDLLIKCNMFRAADYVATEILNSPTPERPIKGPPAVIPSPLSRLTFPDREAEDLLPEEYKIILEKLNNQDYEKGNLISFSISLIESSTKNFCPDFCIGSGAFGTVYKVNLRKYGGPELAIKILNSGSSVAEEQFLTEIKALSEYRHENLVPLIGFCTNGPQYCLVYEYVQKGSLLEAIACNQPDRSPLVWSRRISIMYGIAKGLHFLHTGKERPLIHRDVKSANVLLDDRLVPKICDFGLAKTLSSSAQTSAMTSTIFGTSAYMAPEAFRGDISPKMDIFSFGVIILELLTGLPPFDENRDGYDIVTYLEERIEDNNLAFLLDRRGQIYNIDEAIVIYKLSQRCLDDKKRRPGSEQVLKDLKDVLTLKDVESD